MNSIESLPLRSRRDLGKENYSQSTVGNDGGITNQYGGPYFAKLVSKKKRIFRFSQVKIANGDYERRIDGDVRVFLPFGEKSFTSYYDIHVK